MLDFATTDFDKEHTRSRFIYNKDTEPNYIYRHDPNKFELREIKEQKSTIILCELNIQDIDKEIIDVQFQYAQHFLVGTKVYFLIATRRLDGLESFLYFFDPLSWQSTLRRVAFTIKLTGKFTNIFVSDELKNGSNDDYHILTVGTLDSAIYVSRFFMSDMLSIGEVEQEQAETEEEETNKDIKPLSCTLLRTDARSAITQQIVTLHNQSKTPADIYLVCGGSNGVLDFFLMQSDADITVEPKLQFQRHEYVKLPSKLPVVSIQRLECKSNNQIVLAIGQQLQKISRTSRLAETSMTVLKLNVKRLMCKDTVSIKFPCGTWIMPLKEEEYKLWSYYNDHETARATWNDFDMNTFKFGEKHNTYMELPSSTQKSIQQVYIEKETAWMLSDDQLSISKAISKKGHKRQLST